MGKNYNAELQLVAPLCANSTSPLASLAREAHLRSSVVFDIPAGRRFESWLSNYLRLLTAT
jgi:hypothetical protein